MAEAIAAIGLAASIVQFIDVGSRVVSKASKIYQRGHSAPTELRDAQKSCEGLRQIVEDIQASKSSDADGGNDERYFHSLGLACVDLADEMECLVAEISVSDNRSKRGAIKGAVKMMRKKEQITWLQSRLETFKQDLILHLLDLIRHQAQQSISQQEKVLEKVNALHQGNQSTKDSVRSNGLDEQGMGNIVLNALKAHPLKAHLGSVNTAHEQPSAVSNRLEYQTIHPDLITAIYQKLVTQLEDNMVKPALSTERQKYLEARFLKALQYPSMRERERRIQTAHEKTFKWIFESEEREGHRWSNFKQWLRSGSQLYWITGKAGSGKSTLMKYICQMESEDESSELRCTKFLKEWAGSSKIIMASFYFWNSGAPEQMSQRGLLLSLLSKILEQVPELIPLVSPTKWEALCLFGDWYQAGQAQLTDDELEAMLRSLAKQTSKDVRLCLFVDGLDEFEGQHIDLVNLFNDLIKNQYTKICVSSRPWIIFEDAFKHKPSLMLENLTYSDIREYVTDKLHSDIGFELLQTKEPEYALSLAENIVSKASGVFLWVTIVVTSLLAGMRQGDRISDLQRQLDLLPADLEKLYDKILASLDPLYLRHAAEIFKLVEIARRPPSLLLLSFADEEDDGFALKRGLTPISIGEANNRAEIMRRRLKSRCKGFLEVDASSLHWDNTSDGKIQYLHRTVQEYITSQEAQKTLGSATDTSFDPHLQLLRGGLTCMKCISHSANQPLQILASLLNNVDLCLFHAARIRTEHSRDLISLLDNLDKTCDSLVCQISCYTGNISNPNQLVSFEKAKKGEWIAGISLLKMRKSFQATNFLSLNVEYGVLGYIMAKAPRKCIIIDSDGRKQALLDDAIFIGFVPVLDARKVEMIAYLLEKEADPNWKDPTQSKSQPTIWNKTVERMLYYYDGRRLERPWLKIAELMLKHGASLERTIPYLQTRGENNHAIDLEKARALCDMLKTTKNRVNPTLPSPSFWTRWRQKYR